MQELYCGLTDFSVVQRHDPHITVYGDSNNDKIVKTFIYNLRVCLDNLASLTFREIIEIEDYALSNLQVSRFTLILPDTLQRIGKYAFQGCTAMNDIIIPASVTYIGEGAFYGCPSLDYIYFKEDITITEIPERLCYGGSLKGVGIAYNNGTFTKDDNIEFPESITKINNNAFENCSSMGHTLEIGGNITTVGDYAFYGTSIDVIHIGNGLNSGDNEESEDYVDGGYDTDRDIDLPYTLYLSSKRQFRYKHFVAEENSPAGTIYLMNKEEYVEDSGKTYTYKTEDDNFKFCIQNSHFMVFKNGLLLPDTYYFLHSIVNNPVSDVGVVFNVALKIGDKIDIFYVTNDMKHIECDYYDLDTKERYLQNGLIKISDSNTEYRVMGEQMYVNNTDRTNYIKLRSPLYAISSKHSTFIFLNGKKVRLDELEDISDTIMSINTDYSTEDRNMNAVRLEVLNHLDTQDIIEQIYINDGLNHDDIQPGQFNTTDIPNIYKNTKLIKTIDMTELESYAERTLLDEILNDLSDTNLNKLFYEYDTAKGPMTPYDESKMNEPKFINRDAVLNAIVSKYYVRPTGNNLNLTNPTTEDTTEGTMFYIDENSEIPNSFDGLS